MARILDNNNLCWQRILKKDILKEHRNYIIYSKRHIQVEAAEFSELVKH
jgi:hypothetical protein